MAEVSKEKQEFVERWERVIREKHYGAKSKSWLAKQIGLDNDTLTRYINPKISTKPTISAIKKMAAFFDISTDYLLGVTDVMSTNPTIREICQNTGLSEKAINKLADMKCDKDMSATIISKLIENGTFGSVIDVVEDIIDAQEGRMRNELGNKKECTKKDIDIMYLKLFNKEPIIDYESQYDITKGTIAAFESIVMKEVCSKKYAHKKRAKR